MPQDRIPKRDRGRRLPRRVQSARHRRGGRWPGAFGPRPDKRMGHRVASAMAEAIHILKDWRKG